MCACSTVRAVARPGPTWLTSEEAADRLGVKPQTLYAYVSRGLIHSEQVPGERRSRFLAADVERHAARTRRGGRAGGLELVVETELTLLDPAGHVHYRGWDVEDAARTATFESVASWLWTEDATPSPFEAPATDLAAVADLVDRSGTTPPVDQWRALLGRIRVLDPLRHDTRPVAVAATGRRLVATLVEALPALGRDPGPGSSLAARLWSRLTPAPPSERRIRTVDCALVLMADHELATSTLAARIAASTWADPYLVVQAALATLGGPLHGGASEQCRTLLRDAAERGPAEAVGRVLAEGRRVPGLGHRVYRDRDPRTDVLLESTRAAGADLAVADELRTVVARQALPFANVDFALAALGEAFDFVPSGTETLVAAARTVGWLAHAIEEYEHALRFRTRAAYIGPPPGAHPGSA